MPCKPVNDHVCPNPECPLHGQLGKGNVVRHGFIRLKPGRRRRYRCSLCGRTFCSTTGMPYHRRQRSRSAFDEVAAMSVEGIRKSSIARIKGLSWNTVARWIERAATSARRFNTSMIQGYQLKELQADEIRTFLQHKDQPTWIFAVIEVNSRLWPSAVTGLRSCRNTRRLIRNAVKNARGPA